VAILLVAFAAIAGLAAVLRWTFTPGQDRAPAGLANASGPEDFGLLCPVATVDDPTSARSLQRLMAEAGIRSTVAVARDGRLRVLVFESQLDEARGLVDGAV
jgi:hypothetical protein